MSDDENTRPRPASPRVQPAPPGVIPPSTDASVTAETGEGAPESSVWARNDGGPASLEPSIPGDRTDLGTDRKVQPVPPELVDNATLWAAAEPVSVEPDSGAAGEVVAAPPDAQPVPPAADAATTAPHEVVIVPSAVPERVDVSPPSQASTPPIVPAAPVATPPETTVLRSGVPPQSAAGTGPYGGAGAYPGWGAQPPPSSNRSIVPLVALAIVAALLLGGGVSAWWVARQQDSDSAEIGDGAGTATLPVASTAPTAPASPATNPPAATTATPTPTTAPPTTATTVAPSAAPTAAPAPTSNTVPGDLGLDEPMRRPPCDSQFIVITANAVTPGRYPDEVLAARRRFVGAAYLRTDQTCSSLRASDDLGNPIYSVYYGPFPTLARACEIRNQVGGESYVKILDQTTPYTKIWDC